MRRAIVLVLLIVLGTMPLQTSAQASVPAVDLHCLNIYGEVYDSGTADENSTQGILGLINSSEDEPSANVTCTLTNPNSYVERIQIQVDGDGLDVQTNGTFTLPANGEESFNITLFADQNMTIGAHILNITATVVEANGAPPPNVAEDYVEGIVWIVNDDFLISSSIEITEIGPFLSTTDFYTMENGTEYPVLYLKESFHIDAVLTGWDGNPIANKCLNIYVDPDENTIPIITVNTTESGTIEWFSGDPLQNPSLRGIETTGGKLEGIRTVRIAYEPDGAHTDACYADYSSNLSASYTDIDVLVRSRTDMMVSNGWRHINENSVNDREAVTGEVVLLRDRLDLTIENETIGFQFFYKVNGTDWTFYREEFTTTNNQGLAGFNWSAQYIHSGDICSGVPCDTEWRITAYHAGSLLFKSAIFNITMEVHVEPTILIIDPNNDSDGGNLFPINPNYPTDSDGDGLENDLDPFPNDPTRFGATGDDVLLRVKWTDRNGVERNGKIWITLYDHTAPKHAESFRAHVSAGMYDGIPFHRVVDDFVIQSGDFENEDGTGGYAGSYFGYCSPTFEKTDNCEDDKTRWVVPEEFEGARHIPGSLGGARAAHNNSTGSQFYFVDTPGADFLDGSYTVFGIAYSGEIDGVETTGIEVIDQISQIKCQGNEGPCTEPYGSSPQEATYIVEAKLISRPLIIDSDADGVIDEEDAFPDDPAETHDDDGDGVGNNTDAFPQDPDEQYDKDGDGVGDNADDFPNNKFASNWSTVYIAIGTFIVLLIGAGAMISRMKTEDELPNVPASNDLAQIEKQIQELEQQKTQMIMEQDPTELMFED